MNLILIVRDHGAAEEVECWICKLRFALLAHWPLGLFTDQDGCESDSPETFSLPSGVQCAQLLPRREEGARFDVGPPSTSPNSYPSM
jgi:hypothetical protein